ncbi:hypothetical protein HOK021_40280 [Streptomyces hygroscopicus]|nr:hypothetical protein HOK021_40280 [Streptomyces hygroscopicus]
MEPDRPRAGGRGRGAGEAGSGDGGTARGAARSGAKHTLKVTDTLAAFLQTPPEPTLPVPRKRAQPATTSLSSAPAGNAPTAVPEAAQERPQGLGQISSWATEVVLPVSGTLTTPGKNSPAPTRSSPPRRQGCR